MSDTPKIIYTLTDEAPFLATQSLLPIIDAFTDAAGVALETRDISLAGRILAQFPDLLSDDQKVSDDLAELGALAKKPEANIIKLPNISASVPQIKAAVKELQDQGYPLPDYPDEPSSDEEKAVRARYDKAKGSAVNPVLREGNSDRRAPKSVKAYARKHPHRMGAWSGDSKTHVAHMDDGDFYASEKSATLDKAGALKITLHGADGSSTVLKESVPVLEGEIVDAAVLSRKALAAFIDAQIADAREKGVLFSVHLKATMMKVSDPIIFGVVVSEFYKAVLDKHADALDKAGFSPNNGIGDLYARIESLPGGRARRDQGRHRRAVCRAPEAGHGQLGQGHHQPARAQRRHHRRLDAGDDPRLGQDVERGRRAPGRQGDHPGPLLRRRLPGGDRGLQGERCLRSGDHGQRAQRRPDGTEGRGVRLARQDLPDPGRRHGEGDRRRRQRRVRARGRVRRHLAHVPGQGRADARLGQAGRHPRPRQRHPGRVLAGRRSRPRRAS